MNSRTGSRWSPVFHLTLAPLKRHRTKTIPIPISHLMYRTIETQLSVAMANEPGQIARVSELLSESDIHINAVSIAEDISGGHFRFLTDKADEAVKVLHSHGVSVESDSVLAVRLNDSKGKLANIATALAQANINLDYVYASVDQAGNSTRLVLKVENIPLAKRILDEIADAA